MNWDQIEGNWKQLKGNIQQQWAKLTDDDLDMVAGKRQELAGKIQEAYGLNKEDAEKQVDEWQTSQTELDDELDSNDRPKRTNKFDYDDISGNNSDQDNTGNTPRRMHDVMGEVGISSQGAGVAAGILGTDASDEMDDSGYPYSNPLPNDMEEPLAAIHHETPHQDKSLDQT